MNALMEAMSLIRDLSEAESRSTGDWVSTYIHGDPAKEKKGLASKLKAKIPDHIIAASDKRATDTEYKAARDSAAKKLANKAKKAAAAAAEAPKDEKPAEAPAKTPEVASGSKERSAFGKKIKIHVGSNLTNKQKLANASTLHSLHAAAAQHWGNQAYKHKPGSAEYTKAMNKQGHSVSRMSALRSTIQHLQGA